MFRKKLYGVNIHPARVAIVVSVLFVVNIIVTFASGGFVLDERPWEESFTVASGEIAAREWARIIADMEIGPEGMADERSRLTLLYRSDDSVFKVDKLKEMAKLEKEITELPEFQKWCYRLSTPRVCFPANKCIILTPAYLIDCLIQQNTSNTTLSTASQEEVDSALAVARSPFFKETNPWVDNFWGLDNDHTTKGFILHKVNRTQNHPLQPNKDEAEYQAFLLNSVEPTLQSFQKDGSLGLLYYSRSLHRAVQKSMLVAGTPIYVVPMCILIVLALAGQTYSPIATVVGICTIFFSIMFTLGIVRLTGITVLNPLLLLLTPLLAFCSLHVMIVVQAWKTAQKTCAQVGQTRMENTINTSAERMQLITTVAVLGLGSKLFSELPPEQTYAVVGCLLLGINCLLSLTFLPCVLAIWEEKFPSTRSPILGRVAGFLIKNTISVYELRVPILWIFVILSLISLLGLGIISRTGTVDAGTIPTKHELEKALQWENTKYAHKSRPVKVWLLWGLQASTLSIPSSWSAKDDLVVQYQNNFAFPQLQQSLYMDACRWSRFEVLKRRLGHESDLCILENMESFAKRYNRTAPPNLSYQEFKTLLTSYIHFQHNDARYLFEDDRLANVRFKDGNLSVISFVTRTNQDMSSCSYQKSLQMYGDWERLADDLRELGAKGVFQTSPQWLQMETQAALTRSFSLFSVAAVVAVITHLVLQLNPILTIIYAIVMASSVLLNLAAMFIYGWDSGIISGLSMILVVPFTSAYCLLFIFAYSASAETLRMQRTQDAMSQCIPLLWVSISLILSAIFPAAICQAPNLYRFGIFILTMTILNCFIIVFALPALGFIIGPENNSGDLLTMMGKRTNLLTRLPGVTFSVFVSGGSKLAMGTAYCLMQLTEQVSSVLPVSVYLMGFASVVIGVGLSHRGQVIGGLVLVVMGLFMFLEGLKFGLMPMGNICGGLLPTKLKPWAVQLIAFILGVGVTFAEPAIGALQTIGSLVTVKEAPYLYYVLNDGAAFLVMAVGSGVGLACMVGLLRFLHDWKLRPLIMYSLVPPLILSIIMHWGMPDLRPTIGLAWDCGAVTTGPVTVPLVLALGLGVAQSNKQRKKEAQSGSAGAGSVTSPTETPEGQEQEGPAAMEMMGQVLAPKGKRKLEKIINRATHGLGDKIKGKSKKSAASAAKAAADTSDLDGFGVVTLASLFPVITVQLLSLAVGFKNKDNYIETTLAHQLDAPAPGWWTQTPVNEVIMSLRAVGPLIAFLFLLLRGILKQRLPRISLMPIFGHDDSENDSESSRPSSGGRAAFVLCIALAFALIGMMVFNLGLTLGLSDLGQQVGTIVPSSFAEVTIDESTTLPPKYGYGGGVFVSLAFAWGLGLLATLAEPALQVLGAQVETLTNGDFSQKMLIWAVAFGVATGVALGVAKIVFGIPLIIMLLPSYFVAVVLSFQADEALLGVAWDSAGVTTGPVTVPLVLAMGLAFAKAVKSPDGFGILSLASVGPICSVLILDSVNKVVARKKNNKKEEPEQPQQNDQDEDQRASIQADEMNSHHAGLLRGGSATLDIESEEPPKPVD